MRESGVKEKAGIGASCASFGFFRLSLCPEHVPPTFRPQFFSTADPKAPGHLSVQVPVFSLNSEGCLMMEWHELRTVAVCHPKCPPTCAEVLYLLRQVSRVSLPSTVGLSSPLSRTQPMGIMA